MKIKKKQYEKELSDRYWQGVQMGMRFALENPKDAEKYVDNIPLLRNMAEKSAEVMSRLWKKMSALF